MRSVVHVAARGREKRGQWDAVGRQAAPMDVSTAGVLCGCCCADVAAPAAARQKLMFFTGTSGSRGVLQWMVADIRGLTAIWVTLIRRRGSTLLTYADFDVLCAGLVVKAILRCSLSCAACLCSYVCGPASVCYLTLLVAVGGCWWLVGGCVWVY